MCVCVCVCVFFFSSPQASERTLTTTVSLGHPDPTEGLSVGPDLSCSLYMQILMYYVISAQWIRFKTCAKIKVLLLFLFCFVFRFVYCKVIR